MIDTTVDALTPIVHAVLPHPIGVNATYRSAGTRWYKTPAARQWERDALLLLRAAGVRTLPPGTYWIACELTLHTIRLDIDAPLKLAIDTLAAALGIDDRWIGHVSITKYLATRSKQRLELVAQVEPLPDRDFNAQSARHDGLVEAPANRAVLCHSVPIAWDAGQGRVRSPSSRRPPPRSDGL